MDQLILKNPNTQLTNENQLLKSHVLHLTERFNVIVKWINNQFYGLLGVPDEVVVAISGNLDFIPPVPRSDDEESLPRIGNTNPVTAQTITRESNKGLSYNPFIGLEKLSLANVQSLADSNEITNYSAIADLLSKYNTVNNSPIICTLCNLSFELNIQLKKHKLVHWMKNGNIPRRQTLRKVSFRFQPLKFRNENMFLKLEMLSEYSDSDTSPLHDPLDDSEEIKYSDTASSINMDFIDSISKDDIEIKEEFFEESQTISECEAQNTLRKTLSEEKGKLQYNSQVKNNLKPSGMYNKIGKMSEDSLKCKVCGKVFPMFCRLRVHQQKCQAPSSALIGKPQQYSHGKSKSPRADTKKGKMSEVSLKCKMCGKVFPMFCRLRVHQQKCQGPSNSFIGKPQYNSNGENSPKSPRVYTTKRKLDEDSLKCKVCEKVFPMFCRLRVHEQKCHIIPLESVIVTELEIEGIRKTQTTYKCLKCEASFNSKDEYFLHQKICNPEALKKKIEKQDGPAICDICGKSFINDKVLNQHIRFVHQGEKNFLCTECGRSFSRLDTLRNHERCHTGIKSFKCNYCDQTFVRRQARYTHEKRHLGTLKANCQICGYEFASKAKLKLHIQSVHENQRSYQCPKCEKCFKRKTHLDYHLKTHNNPNSRNRGLNKDIDHMKAAQKRRHCNKKNDSDVQISNEVNTKGCLSDNSNSLLTGDNNSTK